MGKSDKLRIIIWSVFSGIFLCLGILGYYQVYSNNKLNTNETRMLKSLIGYLDSSDDFENLRNVGIKINSKLKNNTIITEYKGENINKNYEFEYDRNLKILNFKCESSDSISTLIIKNMLDAVGIYNGKTKNEIGTIFSEIRTLNEYTISDGMTYTEENGYIKVRVNINVPLKKLTNNENDGKIEEENNTVEPTNYNYFTLEDLSKNKTNIINGEFSDSINNLKMKTTIVNDTFYISIFEEEKLSSNAYNSMSNILKLIIDDSAYTSFINYYNSFENGNATYENITVEKEYIIPTDYETEIVSDKGELVRISFKTTLISRETNDLE